MEDDQIIELYFRRCEQAITETDRKYGGYCYCVANHILSSGPDSEEAVNDTWLQAWNSIPPQRPSVLKMYLARITRNLAFSAYRARTAAKRGGGETELALEELERCIPSNTSVEAEMQGRELGAAIRSFVSMLPQRERNIFIRRYFFVESTADIGNRYGLKHTNVQKILSRTRKKLLDFLTREGYV